MDEIKGDEKSDKMPMQSANKRKRGLTTADSEGEYAQNMSENGEQPYKRRKNDEMSSLHGNLGRQPPKSQYTIQK